MSTQQRVESTKPVPYNLFHGHLLALEGEKQKEETMHFQAHDGCELDTVMCVCVCVLLVSITHHFC